MSQMQDELVTRTNLKRIDTQQDSAGYVAIAPNLRMDVRFRGINVIQFLATHFLILGIGYVFLRVRAKTVLTSVLIPSCILTWLYDFMAALLLIQEVTFSGGCRQSNALEQLTPLLVVPVLTTMISAHLARPTLSRQAKLLSFLSWSIGVALMLSPAIINYMT